MNVSVCCPATLDVSTVADFADELRAVATGVPVEVDAAAITRIDAAGVQLLLAFVRAVAARGAAVAWTGASPALRAAAGTLGLATPLGLSAL